MPTPFTLSRQIGARGAMLLVLSALWFRLFVYPLLGGSSSDADVFYYTWHIEIRVGLWLLSLVCAVAAAFVPPRKDWFGWVALVIMPTQRLSAWVIAWVESAVPGGDRGDPDAGAMVVLYGLIIMAVLVAASMRPPAMEAARTD